jgi:hypothetical protein
MTYKNFTQVKQLIAEKQLLIEEKFVVKEAVEVINDNVLKAINDYPNIFIDCLENKINSIDE